MAANAKPTLDSSAQVGGWRMPWRVTHIGRRETVRKLWNICIDPVDVPKNGNDKLLPGTIM